MSSSRAFTPVALGSKELKHRIAMAPLTRLRAIPDKQAHTDLAVEYYKQRASEGGLIISEATFIAREAGGYSRAPGLYSEEQVEAWKKVVAAVHSKGGVFFAQLWALGRANFGGAGIVDLLKDVEVVGPTDGLGLSDDAKPRALTEEDIQRYIKHYGTAAANAASAGFDGIEIHSANGYLLDQFLQTVTNKRTDRWGGSVENRARFALEAVAAAVEAIGQERVGIRFSPFGTFQGMGMADPYADGFLYVVEELTKRYPKLAYIHMSEAREWAPGAASRGHLKEHVKPSLDPFRAIVRGVDREQVGFDETYVFPEPSPERPTVFITASGYDDTNTKPHVERTGDVVAIGRYFIANPDLPRRIRDDIPLTKYDRSTFYSYDANGYIDYPTVEQQQAKI